MTWFWIFVIAAMVVIEASTLGLTTIWFAAGGAAALIAELLGASLVIQAAFFFAVSILMLALLRPFAKKYINQKRVPTNADALIGKDGVVDEEIDNLLGKGSVKVDGRPWSARAKENDGKIAKDSIVRVTGISGVRLIVEKKPGEEENT